MTHKKFYFKSVQVLKSVLFRYQIKREEDVYEIDFKKKFVKNCLVYFSIILEKAHE